MNVELVTCTANPEWIAGLAAATCTRSSRKMDALRHAIAGGHESVIEHVSFTFRVSGVSRALLAQITRHRIASYSVESQRYCDMASFEAIEPQSIKGDPEAHKAWTNLMRHIRAAYKNLTDMGVPKEDARYVTPQAAATSFVVTMNARELRHFFALRCCNRAQWEIRELANEMLRICRSEAPDLFADAGPGCVRGGCPEEKPCGHPVTGEG